MTPWGQPHRAAMRRKEGGCGAFCSASAVGEDKSDMALRPQENLAVKWASNICQVRKQAPGG